MSILPQLERDLGRAADERLRANIAGSRPQFRSRVRVAVAGLPVVLSVLVAVVIAVIALGSFRHGHGSVQPAGPKTSPRAELIRAIAVLRQPQVPADRGTRLEQQLFELGPPAKFLQTHPQARKRLARAGYPAPERALFRVVPVPSLHAHVLIAPTTYKPSAASSQRTEGLNLLVQSPGNLGIGTGPRPATVGSFLAHGLNIFFGMGTKANPGVLLVPDGVARVTFGPARPLPFQTPYRVDPKAVAEATATVHATAIVHDNIAAFNLKVPTIASPHAYSFTPAINATTPTTWYAANGSVIRHTTTKIFVLVNVIGRPRGLPPICRHVPRLRNSSICKH